ncbi:MAG: SCO family protein [Fuerstiella sp.]
MLRLIVLSLCLVSAASPGARAQLTTAAPTGIEDVGIDDRSGERLPLTTPFTDSTGRSTTLEQFFDGQRPVVLTFNYSDCPMLCKLQLHGLVESLKKVDWVAGEQFRVLSISIDPAETPAQAAVIRQNHLQAYGRPGAEDGWIFLTGSPASIRAASNAAGFRFKYLPKQREFSHTAAAIVCAPDGMISRYLYGVDFDPQTLRLSLAEAAEGRIASPLDKLLLYCFRYDAATGRYAPAAWKLMRLGAITTVVLLGIFVLRFRFAGNADGRLPSEVYKQP